MMPTDITISLASWALNIEKQRASISALNIANINTTGLKRTGDFDALISDMSRAVTANSFADANQLVDRKVTVEATKTTKESRPTALDDEVLSLSLAKERFKAITEALSKKYGLMNLATRGK